MKKILKTPITLFMALALLITIFTSNAYAIESGEGPYKITLNPINAETKKNVSGGTFQIIKTHNLNLDTGEEVKLDKPETVIPIGDLTVEKDGSFILDKETVVTIPKNYEKGIYTVKQTKRAPGYHLYNGNIIAEFPKIENGEFAKNQIYKVNIEMNEVSAGFKLNIFAEDEKQEMNIFNFPVSLQLVKTHDSGGKQIEGKIEKFTYNHGEDNLVSNLTEGKYVLNITNLPSSSYLKPQGNYMFDVVCNEKDEKVNVSEFQYTDRDSAIQTEDMNVILFIYKKPQLEISYNTKEEQKPFIVGETIKGIINVKNSLIFNNYNSVNVEIESKNTTYSITNNDNNYSIIKYDTKDMKPIELNALILDNKEQALNVSLKFQHEKFEAEYKESLFKDVKIEYGSYVAKVTYYDGGLIPEQKEAKGQFLIENKDGLKVGDVTFANSELKIQNLPIGEYKVLYKPDETERIKDTKEVAAFKIDALDHNKTENIVIKEPTNSIIYILTALTLLGAIVFSSIKIKKNKGKKDEK